MKILIRPEEIANAGLWQKAKEVLGDDFDVFLLGHNGEIEISELDAIKIGIIQNNNDLED